MKNYEIWVLGENEDCSCNDFELLITIADNLKYAEWLFTLINNDLSNEENMTYNELNLNTTPRARLVLEEVEENECIDIVKEAYIK